MELTFDKAIELLEIVNINKIHVDDIPQLEKRAKKRWHPDKVAHLQDQAITREYTDNFQLIEEAAQIVHSYLTGSYQTGETFINNKKPIYEEPEEIIRKEASNIQSKLNRLWDFVKKEKYKWEAKETILSNGSKLSDLLNEDFKEDIAMLSVISFYYGLVSLGLLAAIASAISTGLGEVVSIICLLQLLSCVLGFIPLSRFWLHQGVAQIAFKFVDFGLSIYYWVEDQVRVSTKSWVILLIRIPVIFARILKYIVLFPLYELTKLFVGDKIIGEVKESVNYYADAAEWYIDELLSKNPEEMTGDELFHLSYLYNELSGVPLPTSSAETQNDACPNDNKTDVRKESVENPSPVSNTKPRNKKKVVLFGVGVFCLLLLLFASAYFLNLNNTIPPNDRKPLIKKAQNQRKIPPKKKTRKRGKSTARSLFLSTKKINLSGVWKGIGGQDGTSFSIIKEDRFGYSYQDTMGNGSVVLKPTVIKNISDIKAKFKDKVGRDVKLYDKVFFINIDDEHRQGRLCLILFTDGTKLFAWGGEDYFYEKY
jgi:hypothetical protein